MPDLDYVNNHLRYAPSGHLYWKTKNGTIRRTDVPAGGRHGNSGYRQISILGKLHYAHRVIWFIHHGPIPPGIFVDHVNGELDADGWKDDRIENLRLATPAENVRNRGCAPKSSSVGIRGSYWCKRLNRFITRIGVNGKAVSLGVFECPWEAASAFNLAAITYFGAFAGKKAIVPEGFRHPKTREPMAPPTWFIHGENPPPPIKRKPGPNLDTFRKSSIGHWPSIQGELFADVANA